MGVEERYKTRAIVAHITLIGWIIALVQNSNDDKSEFASFYIRQMLGLIIVSFGLNILSMILGFIPILSSIISIVVLLIIVGIWVLSLIGAINGKKEPTPFIGHLFQQWFRSL